MDDGKDFNHIKEWLNGKLAERGLSVNKFVLKTGNQINTASIFRWYSDRFRPTPEKMMLVCDNLSAMPIVNEKGEPLRYEEVPLREGLAQFRHRPWRERSR